MIFERLQKLFSGSIENPNVPLGWEAISEAIQSRGGGISDAGIVISQDTAMRYGAVFACTRVISSTLGSLPLKVFKLRKSGGRDEATDNRAYPILGVRANDQMSSMVWREAVQANTLLHGGGYSEIQYDNAGRLVAIWPLQSYLTGPVRDVKGFRFRTYDTADGQPRDIEPEDMIYTPGLGFNGVIGLSVISYARQNIGLGLAAEKFGAKLFANGAKMSGILMLAQKLSENARKNLVQSFNEQYQGADNAHKTLVLEENAKYQQTSIPPEDAQFLETRKFQRSEICGWFGVPPHLTGDLEKATFSNIEQQDLEFAKHCMRPWLVRWEQELNWKLFKGTDYFCQFDLDDLLRGDFKTRQEGLAIQRNGGIIYSNEWRDKEGMNPMPDKDNIVIVPANMTTPQALLKAAAAAATQPADPNQPAKPTDPVKPGDDKKQKAEITRPVMRDAIGRILKNEKKEDTFVERAFLPVLHSLVLALSSKATPAFLSDYCDAVADRSKTWHGDQVEAITDSEFTRAIEALESQ